jgi:hypothetical protein
LVEEDFPKSERGFSDFIESLTSVALDLLYFNMKVLCTSL